VLISNWVKVISENANTTEQFLEKMMSKLNM